MDSLVIKGTQKTPTVDFNYSTGVFLIEGRSIPENSIDFYKPVFDWLESYSETPLDDATFDMKLEYFNTSSSKCLVEIFRRLENIQDRGVSIQVNWFFDEEDEDMEESGQDFKGIIRVPINMISVEED